MWHWHRRETEPITLLKIDIEGEADERKMHLFAVNDHVNMRPILQILVFFSSLHNFIKGEKLPVNWMTWRSSRRLGLVVLIIELWSSQHSLFLQIATEKNILILPAYECAVYNINWCTEMEKNQQYLFMFMSVLL